MIGILDRGEKDADHDWRNWYCSPVLAVRGISEETVVTRVESIPNSIPKETRERVVDALNEYPYVRLVPIWR